MAQSNSEPGMHGSVSHAIPYDMSLLAPEYLRLILCNSYQWPLSGLKLRPKRQAYNSLLASCVEGNLHAHTRAYWAALDLLRLLIRPIGTTWSYVQWPSDWFLKH
jgi:hypothetical protein